MKKKKTNCPICGNEFEQEKKHRYWFPKYCSDSCMKEGKRKEYRDTSILHWGVPHAQQTAAVKEVMKQHANKRSKEEKELIWKKRQQTNLQKYGVRHPFQNEDIYNKFILSMKEKYGVESANQIEGVQEKKKNTWKNKTPAQMKNILEKQQKTFFKKYGVDSVFKSPLMQKKRNDTFHNPEGRHFFMERYLITNQRKVKIRILVKRLLRPFQR
jgi:hypothetical protein